VISMAARQALVRHDYRRVGTGHSEIEQSFCRPHAPWGAVAARATRAVMVLMVLDVLVRRTALPACQIRGAAGNCHPATVSPLDQGRFNAEGGATGRGLAEPPGPGAPPAAGAGPSG